MLDEDFTETNSRNTSANCGRVNSVSVIPSDNSFTCRVSNSQQTVSMSRICNAAFNGAKEVLGALGLDCSAFCAMRDSFVMGLW